MGPLKLSDVGRLPAPGDNAAIACLRLEAGTDIALGDGVCRLSGTVPEGHRFAVAPIEKGGLILSWGLPFGRALRDIRAGEYLCNAGMLESMRLRDLDFALPEAPNFEDAIAPCVLDEVGYRPGEQVPLYEAPGTFAGYPRPGGRGTGTRNCIVLLGTTSLTASFVRLVAARLAPLAKDCPGIDGIVAVAHTEGGEPRRPNNLEFLLRALAGFIVHPNVAAVLAVDHGTESVTNAMLGEYLRAHDYPLDHVPHSFLSLSGRIESDVAAAEATVRGWVDSVAAHRVECPLSGLRVGLQCGGSDAFSGVSANPLAGRIAREVLRHGGSANLAETDELIGAESYVLASTRDLATARRFLEKIETFRERVAWHGHGAEGNPTAGNKLRGLYNLAIKSIGAARKKDPDVRLDYVIDYAERMTAPGFYFMDSPGNDLESTAGQVAAGCNLVLFTTGSGSITNFPFVPTIKIVTTTSRWNLLSRDMDINAGRYLDGMPLDELASEGFAYAVSVASGARCAGERAGHAQVSIWRDWRQSDGSRLEAVRNRPRASGRPIRDIRAVKGRPLRLQALPGPRGPAADQVGLLLPTSLCAGQVALRIAADLNAEGFAERRGLSRFVALAHTEGCGASTGENEEDYLRMMVGHLVHPFVRRALLLEHGCERTHNSLFRRTLERHGIDPGAFGFASIQLDGGIERVSARVRQWFAAFLPEGLPLQREPVGIDALSLGLTSAGKVSELAARGFARAAARVAGSGGTVVIPANASLLAAPAFLEELGLASVPAPTLEFGEAVREKGLHVMATPTEHFVETASGLGGTGVQVLAACRSGPALQGHPMIPLIQVTEGRADDGADLVTDAGARPEDLAGDLLETVCRTASGLAEPRLWSRGYTDFQVTRGLLGVSL